MTLSIEDIRACIEEPEYAAELADLVYVTDQHLNIHRKKYGRGYTYLIDNESRLTDKAQLKRIKSLVIPPAWQQVRISAIDNGHLQVVGRDAKNRKVYLYHDLWNLVRNQTKFFKMSAFAKALPKIRKQLVNSLQLAGMTREKCLALVIKIMDETYVRIGSSGYAKRNGTYGLSTMRMRHLTDTGSKIIFDFKGKHQIDQHVEIDDAQLVKAIQQCEEIPGWELFQYYDDDGNHQSIESHDVNDYLHTIAGDIFSAKDFRTWGATREFYTFLLQSPDLNTEKDRDANLLQAYDAAAEALGNTRSVCREYYVHPHIADVYKQSGFVDERKEIKELKDRTYFTAIETRIQQLIDDFEIEFKPSI